MRTVPRTFTLICMSLTMHTNSPEDTCGIFHLAHAPLPCMPPAMHAPSCHAAPPLPWSCPRGGPCMPPLLHTHLPARGGMASQHAWGRHHACPPCGQTDTCKNITFPQLLLRAVKIVHTERKITVSPLKVRRPFTLIYTIYFLLY